MECGAMECLTTQHISLHRSIYKVYPDLSGSPINLRLFDVTHGLRVNLCRDIDAGADSTFKCNSSAAAVDTTKDFIKIPSRSCWSQNLRCPEPFASCKKATNKSLNHISLRMVCIKMRRVRLASQTMVNDMVLLRFTEAISSCECCQPSSLARALWRRKRSGICSRATPLVSCAVVSVSIPNGCEWICENYTWFQLLPKRNKSLM